MYQRDQPGRVGVHRDVAAVRLARAIDALRLLSRAIGSCETTPATLRAITDQQGVSADQRWRTQAASRSSTAIASSAITRSIPDTLDDPMPLDFVTNIAKLSAAMLSGSPRRSDQRAQGHVQLDVVRLGGDVPRLRRQQPQAADAAVRVRAGRHGWCWRRRAQVGYAFGRIRCSSPIASAPAARPACAATLKTASARARIDGLPVGGDRLVILNQEARFPIYRWVNGVVFVDAGNIFAKGETMSWSELKVGYGFGPALRYAGRPDPRRRRLPGNRRSPTAEAPKRVATSASGNLLEQCLKT